MLLKISSTNSNLSYMIGKNPASPPKIDSVRKGYSIGWFSDNSYIIYFVDSPDEVSFPSYKDQEFEYLAAGKFNCPLIAKTILNNYFSKVYTEYDVANATHTLTIYSLKIKRIIHDLILKHLDCVTLEQVSNDIHNVRITRTGTFQDFIYFCELFAVLVAFALDEYIEATPEVVTRYFQRAALLDMPYWVRYLLKVKMIKNSPKKFDAVREFINSDGRYEITPYNNINARLMFCKPFYNGVVVDIGCGEGKYLSRYAAGCTKYIGIDIDKSCIERCRRIVNRKNLENVELYTNLMDVPFKSLEGSNIIMTEVIEHMDVVDLSHLLDLLKGVPFRNLIITTPNKSFNDNYGLVDELRHDDHKWEASTQEVHSFLLSKFRNIKNVSVHNVGDVVNGEATTTGVVIS